MVDAVVVFTGRLNWFLRLFISMNQQGNFGRFRHKQYIYTTRMKQG